jgi:hypothetical protein
MKKVKLSVDELTVESFSVAVEDVQGTVWANDAPSPRTHECPCIASEFYTQCVC